MRYYDPDYGVRQAPVGVYFRTEEEYENYREYHGEEDYDIKVWPLEENIEDDEDDR